MDHRRLALLRDLERALLEALSESADVHRSLERMHGAGYTLQLFLDCQRESERPPERAGGAESPVRLAEERRSGVDRRGANDGERRSPGNAGEPLFRINSDDLRMLRALGIDPTRKGRARR